MKFSAVVMGIYVNTIKVEDWILFTLKIKSAGSVFQLLVSNAIHCKVWPYHKWPLHATIQRNLRPLPQQFQYFNFYLLSMKDCCQDIHTSQRNTQATSEHSASEKKKNSLLLSNIFEYKIQKAASDLFYHWLFLNFSFLPNLSVFQTTSVSNSSLSKKIIALALLLLRLAFFCPLISFPHE